jgi:hypothetical protein
MSDITLPADLASRNLSLQEIGAIFTMFSIQSLTPEDKTFWCKDETFTDVCASLIDKNYVTVGVNDGQDVSIDIDLDIIRDDNFWDVYDYDENDNAILSHNSHYGDAGSPFLYLVYRELKFNQIFYTIQHSEFGLVEDYVESLEEAQEIIEGELEQELINIAHENTLKSDGGQR